MQSLQALLQWLYLRRIKLDHIEGPVEEISAAIELARLAHMCQITGLESQIAECIKNVLLENPGPFVLPLPLSSDYSSPPDAYVYYLEPKHIASATCLPSRHPVRRTIAVACVDGFIRSENRKFRQQTVDYPLFAVDLLEEVRVCMKEMSNGSFKNPLSGETASWGVKMEGE